MTSVELIDELGTLKNQLFNPIKGTEFETMLMIKENKSVCPTTLVRLIEKDVCRFRYGSSNQDICPGLGKIFEQQKFDYAQMALSVRQQLPTEVDRVEKHLGKTLTGDEGLQDFFIDIDEYLTQNYEPTDTCNLDLYNDMLLVSSSILSHDLDTSSNSNPRSAYRHLIWEPILQTLTNLDALVTHENPITLKYLFIALHDINIAHILGSLGYYSEV